MNQTRQHMQTMGRLLRGGTGVLRAKGRGGSFPFSMTFILTNRCNFRCSYCNIPATKSEEMSTAEIKDALSTFAKRGLVRASFSGGEALLRPDTVEIIGHAKSLGLMTSLNTNAWFTQPLMTQLAGVLDLLVLSLDGPRAEHDTARRQVGSYERVIASLDAARSHGLATATITVLSSANVHVIDDVIALAQTHGAYAYVQPAYESCFDFRDGFDPSFSDRIFGDIAARLRLAHKRNEPVGASPGYVERLAKGPFFSDCSQCSAGRFWGTVLPDGTLLPCHLLQDQPGATPWPNGRELGFSEAFDRLHRVKAGPGCAISPYQETDLIFSLDRRAMASAVRRLLGQR